MPAHGAVQDHFLQVFALAHQVIQGVPVGDAHRVLFDDGAFIEPLGDVVAGRADDLDAFLVRLPGRAFSRKGGQERMGDVDDLLAGFVDETRA